MAKYKIIGEIEADDEEDARFKATIEGGNGVIEFEEIKDCKEETVDGEIFWDNKGKPLFAIIPMEQNVFDYLDINQENGIVTIDAKADNSSSEKLIIKDGRITEVI